MAKLNWEKAVKMQKIIRNGAKFGYDELPSVGSAADRIRYLAEKRFAKSNGRRKKVRR
jgi:hypothetical protein